MSVERTDPLNFEAVARWNDEIAYAASVDYNALFKVSLSSGDAEYVQMFPNEKPNDMRLFTAAVNCGGKIYFVPASADHIAIYEPDKNRLYNLQIQMVDQGKYPHYKINAKFNGGMVIGKYIYMTPCTYPGIIRINSDDDTIEYYSDWVGDGNYMFRKVLLLDENIIYLPSSINNRILRFDTTTCRGQLIKIGTKDAGWWSMCKHGEDYWLAPQKPGPIVKWNPEKNMITEFSGYPTGFDGKDFYFTKVFSHGDQIVLIPAKANMGIIVNAETGDMIPLVLTESNKDLLTAIGFETDQWIYLGIFGKGESQYIKLNTVDLSIESYAFNCTQNIDQLNHDIQCNLWKSQIVVSESKCFELNDFLKRL